MMSFRKTCLIKLLKIDTEGHELPVLQGARSTLGRVLGRFFLSATGTCANDQATASWTRSAS